VSQKRHRDMNEMRPSYEMPKYGQPEGTAWFLNLFHWQRLANHIRQIITPFPRSQTALEVNLKNDNITVRHKNQNNPGTGKSYSWRPFKFWMSSQHIKWSQTGLLVSYLSFFLFILLFFIKAEFIDGFYFFGQNHQWQFFISTKMYQK
jgi:hypothetical protein